MSKSFAIIVDGVIGNVIVADDASWIENHPDYNQFEYVDITGLDPMPAVFWKKEGNKFIKPEILLPENLDHRVEDNWLEVEVNE